MAQARKQNYRSVDLSELTRQLLYAPPAKRADVVRHAERLHDELDAASNYPIDFIVYRLTDRRVPPEESVMLVGEAIKPDLRLMIDALSRSIELAPEPQDPGETTAELAKRLEVSTKTIARWRDRGLRWRWGIRAGKPTVLITRSALKSFERDNTGHVLAASSFSRLSPAERERLITRARRLARATDVKQQAILRHLANRSGRSLEALRQLIHEHDRSYAENPEVAVFTNRTGPLTTEQKQTIDEAYRNGTTVNALCQQFSKTRATIYRVIHESRADRIAQIPITSIDSPVYSREDADEVLMQPIPPQDAGRLLGSEVTASLPDSLKAIYDRPIAPDGTTRSLIVRYNYLKHRARQVQQNLETNPVRATDLDRFDQLWRQVRQVRGEVIKGLLPIVLSVVRRQLTGGFETPATLPTMLDRGNAVLIEEIDIFDPSLSHQFESVLTNRLLRVLAQPNRNATADVHQLIQRLEEAGWQAC